MDKIPTLIHTRVTTVNPEVCDVCEDTARVRYPNGDGQTIHGYLKNDARRFRNILFRWLSQHVDAVRAEYDHDHSPHAEESAPSGYTAADIVAFLERPDVGIHNFNNGYSVGVQVHIVECPGRSHWLRGKGDNVISAARAVMSTEKAFLAGEATMDHTERKDDAE
jgi:hypothetical protein